MIFMTKTGSKSLRRCILTAALVAFAAGSLSPTAWAQSSEPKAADQKPANGDKREAVPKRIDEIAEVGRLLTGPAANPECVWLGRRVISLLWRDDLDTAFRHLDLYDRFGCPGGQIQATFRCVVRQGDIDPKAPDPKAPDALNGRIHACWINPSMQAPAPAAAAATPSENPTTSR
ncbi:MAG: beta-1-3, beta-1-6-glucan biosynthesis protein [Xanthobacteraceae bacterium]